MDWQQWFYLIYTVSLGICLYGFLAYLYSSKKRRTTIEQRKNLIFVDDPYEPRINNSQK